jgi:integrase
MATVYKRGDIWWARFFDADGKRVSHSTGKTRKREAESEAAKLEVESKTGNGKNSGLPKAFAVIIETAAREAASGELTLARAEDLVMRLHRLANPDFKVTSLSDHLSKWVRDQEANVSASTAGIYWDMHRRITEHVGVKVASAPVGDLTADQVRKALEKAKETGLKSSTVNMDLGALRRALHAAVAAGLAKVNVAAGIKPMSEEDSTERAPFTAEEVRKMIDHPKTNAEWKGAILLAAHTGLRLGDVVKLSREHVDGTRLVIRPTKTKKSKKMISIPLSPPALGWIGVREGLFFPTLSTRVPGTLSTTFTRIMASANVDRDIVLPGGIKARRSFHCLRHSFTSWLAEADVHADIRQKLTGHSSSKIHQLYTHHDEALDRAVGTLPAL